MENPSSITDGLTIRGIPLHVSHPGEVFWVDENAGFPGRGTFKNPDVSYELAMSRCVADRGDVIIGKPGHIENISAAADLTCDIAGVALIGTGRGSKQTKIVWDTISDADIDITAANVSFSNLWLYNNYADVDGAFDVSAAGDYFTIQDCVWTDGSSSLDLEEGVNLAVNADHFAFINNIVKLYTGGDTESLIFTAGESVDMTVTGNSIIMPATAAIFDINATALTGTPLFRNNFMLNLDTSTGLSVSIHSSTVAMFVDEMYGSDKDNTVPAATLTNSFMYYCNGVDQADYYSVAWPATATAW